MFQVVASSVMQQLDWNMFLDLNAAGQTEPNPIQSLHVTSTAEGCAVQKLI